MAEHFLTKGRVAHAALVQTAEGIVLERAAAMRALLEQEAGSEAAELFAQPILGRPNDAGDVVISWYSDRAGEPRRLSELDRATREDVEARLTRRLADVGRLLRSADLASGIGAMLTIPDASSIWVIAGQPVIAGWGIAAPGAGTSETERNQAYASTLGKYLPLANASAAFAGASAIAASAATPETPPVSDAMSETTAPASAATEAAFSGQTTAASAGATGTGAGTPPPAGPSETDDTPSGPSRFWALWPALALIALLILVLIWLLLPNTRLFPEAPTAIERQLDEGAALLAQEENRVLRERAEALEQALDLAVCTDSGDLVLPDGRTPNGLLPPPAPDASGTDETDVPETGTREGDPAPLVPPDPSRLQVPPTGDTPEANPASLLDEIEARTVLIIAQGGEGAGIGTGFFIGPDLVATNHHVIENAIASGDVFVTNSTFGSLQPAQILSHDGPFENTGGDFALLRIPGASAPFFPVVNPSLELRLQGVIAAGFPMDIMQSDQRFQQLMQGDPTAMPEMIVTDGVVNAVQPVADGVTMVTHSAPISRGNSGGPLIDMCGRVVGMNTFVREEAFRNLNLAQSTDNLLGFLQGASATVDVAATPCVPQIGPVVQAPAQAPPAEAPADAPDAENGE